MIYKPKGGAGEYADLAVNLYTGCSHACVYCYCPKVLHKEPIQFHGVVAARKDILKQVAKEAPLFCGMEVFLCFTCDPYQPLEERELLTQRILELFYINGVIPVVLTKNKLVRRDMALIKSCKGKVGMTIVFDNDDVRRQFEPEASTIQERYDTLKLFHDQGVPTWISMEPVIYPDEALKAINATHEFVDMYKIGKINYNSKQENQDWSAFKKNATEVLDGYGKKYIFKNSLKEY